jgi:hypothetical protein
MPLKFETNVPNELRLRSITGELVDSQFGGQQYRFISEAGAFYVSETVGNLLHDRFATLGVKAGEAIEICKREVNRNGRKSIQWEVARVGFAIGERGDGTFAVSTPEPASELEKQLAASLAAVEARKAPARAAAPAAVHQVAPAMVGWQQTLLAQTTALTDVYAAALAYASEKHGNAVKPEDIRNMMTTAFIGLQKGGAQRAA